MKKVAVFVFAALTTILPTHAAVFWTVKAAGVHTSTSGTVAINIGPNIPTGPNPSGTEWVSCTSNWVYFHKRADGSSVEEKHVDRMLSVAISAFKTGGRLRLAINRDSNNKCYTAQIFDQGP